MASQLSAVTPTPEQLEMFMQLPKAQQEALAAQYGIDLNSLQQTAQNTKPSPTLNELVSERESNTGREDRSNGNDKNKNTLGDRFNNETESTELILDDNQLVRCIPRYQVTEEQKADLGTRVLLPTFDMSTRSKNGEEKTEEPAYSDDYYCFAEDSNFTKFSLDKDDEEKLKPFGYELFAGEPSTFAPVSDVPVPSNYILGPGDTIRVKIYGKEAQDYSLVVNREGDVEIPKLGPFSVVGKSFSEVRQELRDEITNRIIGVRTNISMGELRSIRVFVLGEAYKPASYTLSSLSTVTQAIFAAGGISDIGSLRKIQVKRQGDVVASLDLYDFLLKGDTSGDVSLMAGDVVFIPTRGKTVSVKGSVTRPAIYELTNESSVEEIIQLAGGLLPTAFSDIVKLERITPQGLKQVVNVNLNSKRSQLVKNGDIIEVSSTLDTVEKSVTLLGHVARPGVYGWYEGMRLSEILKSIHDFKPQPDLNYILITRENPLTGAITAYDVNYSDYLSDKSETANFTLSANDTVYVFNREEERSLSLRKVIEQLQKQTTLAQPPRIVTIKGAVRNPGNYPLSENGNVTSVLRAAMGYTQQAELDFVLLARINQQNFKTELKYIDLTNTETLKLAPLDRLFVFSKNEPRKALIEDLIEELGLQATKGFSQQLVTISGDVRFPGVYPYVAGMTKDMLVDLAGGLNDSSYMLNAELTRFNTNEISDATLLHQTVSLNDELVLKPLDTLLIKRIPEWRERRTIKLAGEVKFPGEYVLQAGETLSSVIHRAGGLTELAYPNGAVFTREALKLREQEQIDRLSKELESDIASLSIDKSDDVQKVSSEEADRIKERLKTVSAIGRLVIDLPALLAGNEEFDLALNNGDELYIPKISQSVTVLGEVQYPTSHIYDPSVDVSDYISRSGGLKVRADDDRIYVVRANGSVYKPSTFNWYSLESKLAPGDTIVVPLDTEYRDTLSSWSTATSILYNTAIVIAAINGL
jgi:polysaccharide export outer membrane protein